MGQVYNTQTFYNIIAEYTKDVSDIIASAVIKHIDPDGNEGEWSPTTIDALNKQIVYNNPEGFTLKNGEWKAWSHATTTTGKTLPGKPDTFTIKVEGTS